MNLREYLYPEVRLDDDDRERFIKYTPSKGSDNCWFRTRSKELQEEAMQDKIRYECDSIKEMLIDKNATYGNSALDPIRVFSGADAVEQLKVRIDDKLSRFYRGTNYLGDDDIIDLIGYLVLLKIAMEVGE